MKRFNECMKKLDVPEEWCGPLKNPCKGWVGQPGQDGLRGLKATDNNIFSAYNEGYFKMFSTAYTRFSWMDVNPSKGVYDFSIIDKFLSEVGKLDWTAGIGFMCPAASTTNKLSLLPQYLYDEGMEYIETVVENNHNFEQWKQRVPIWNDPVYLKYCEEIIEKLAERYDGDKRIFFINPLTYGNWGEWHTQFLGDSEALKFEEAKVHVELWARHFKKTIMQIPVNHHMPEMVAQWACDKYGWGMTRWGLVFQTEDQLAASYCLNTAPALGEFYTTYERTCEWGAWSDKNMTFTIEGGHLTNMRPYADNPNLIYIENRALMEKLQNRMGYHIVVLSAAEYFESNEENEDEYGIALKNKGVAPMYFDCKLVAAYLDERNIPVEKFVTDVNPRKWLGDSYSAFRFRIPHKDNLKVAIGLFKDIDKVNPDVQWANTHLVNNWMIIK